MTDTRNDLRQALTERVLVADGAMGTMLQSYDLTLDDFEGHEGCNEVLNVTRPDVVRAIHDAYYEVGVDMVETNTFGANWANLAEYGITDRIRELAEAGARIARESADAWSTPEHPRFVLGSVGPGTKLPTLKHAPYALLRDAYQEQAEGMLVGGVDAILVETVQDILQAKAALVGARRAMTALGIDAVLIVQITVETTGTMLLGTETGAALVALEPLGIDFIGLNCATGPAEMSEHLRLLSQQANVGLSCMPNAGLPVLVGEGAQYPLTPDELADAHDLFTTEYGLSIVGGCCGTTPEHLRAVVERVGGRAPTARSPKQDRSASSLYQPVPFRQDAAFLSIGERTNANGSKAFREAMVEGRLDDCIEIAKAQQRDGAHLLDLCVDYVGRDGVADMIELSGLLATSSTLPIVLDSTEPEVVEAGLEMLGGRCVVNSVNYEDGDGPESRIRRMMPIVREHGAAVVALTIDEEGQARDAAWKFRVASRLIDDLTGNWGMDVGDILVDALTFPIATGQEETRRDGIETIEAIRQIKAAYPDVQTTLGVSNVSFGLNPAARQVLNSVFLHECQQAGLDSAILHASKIVPIARVSDEQREAALDLVYDRRTYDDDGNLTHDPLAHFLQVFEGVESTSSAESRAEELAKLPLFERLEKRIVDGERNGLDDDLAAALAQKPALAIVNDTLLSGMKTVGELFGSGQMQLPFVLQSAEVMKKAVAYLEPHMERSDDGGKGRMVLATVKGDVHDIGKNLVDIILTNNGYEVVNLGIKQPINTILDAAAEHNADAIGMSGLLVKSTVIMRDNLKEMNQRGVADRWPVLLGGAALTRAFVEQDLADLFDGEVRYARDAFEGLNLMDAVMAIKRGDEGAALPERRQRRVRSRSVARTAPADIPARADIAGDNPLPTPPFWGDRVVKGIALADYVAYLDERALFRGQWGLTPSRGEGPDYDELVQSEGRPRLRALLDKVQTEGLLEAAVVYGYFPAWAEGNDIVIGDPAQMSGGGLGSEKRPDEFARLSFPRQQHGRFLCLADYIRPVDLLGPAEVDVLEMQVVTVGTRVAKATEKLFASNSYREYLELHGLSVQLAEALAEYWHSRVRSDLGVGSDDDPAITAILKQKYQGERFSFGYPACPELEQQTVIFDLLDPGRINVELSEEYMLHPEQSTSALVFHHPQASYFNAT
ncbi:MAG: methionine synthase [Candidatus Nanopelagicales bacterium]|nr:methionine synthase [Candidatus Nanopelagicales bacterium]